MLPEPGTVKGLILIAFFVVTGGFTPCPIITLFILLLLLSKRAPSLISLVKTSLLSWVNTVVGAVGFRILAAALSINRFPASIATVLPTSRAFLPISFAASFPALRAVDATCICLAAFDTNSFLKKPATVSNIPAPPKMGDRAFEVAGPRTWNSLPATIRETKTLPAFKKQLKLYLIGNPEY